VRDVARAVLAVSRRGYGAELPTVVNVGRGIPVSSRWVVHRLARIAHFDGDIVEEGQGSPRSGTVSWQWADTTVARTALGCRPATCCRKRSTRRGGQWPGALRPAAPRPQRSHRRKHCAAAEPS